VQILQTIRFRHDPEPTRIGLPALDKIINAAILDKSNPPAVPPIIEIASQAPGSGTTHIIYLLTATAVLPTSLGGEESCVAILDTDNTFSVPRLVQQLRLALPPDTPPSTIATALSHVHIFRPQSLTCLHATLQSLPEYFLRGSHQSTRRPLSFLALDSLTAFHWQTKAAEEDRAFANQHPPVSEPSEINPTSAGEAATAPHPDLPTLLKTTTTTLSTPLLLTSHSLAINTPRSALPTLRFTVSRCAVRNFPPAISVVEALREAGDRQRAVEASSWEVRVADSGSLRGKGFDFRIGSEGVRVESGREG
jgi:DNA-repair protein XRCC2